MPIAKRPGLKPMKPGLVKRPIAGTRPARPPMTRPGAPSRRPKTY